MNKMNNENEIAEIKAALRKEIRQMIRELPADYVEESNAAICSQVMTELDEYQGAEKMFCFVGTKMEIDTLSIIEHALVCGKTVAVPLCTGDGIMEARIIKGVGDLEPGAYDILEPRKDCPIIDPKEIDLAIVPCISCDRECGRLGQGGGFYDRFMENRSFPAIAICREKLMLESVPKEPWDLPVDAVVTEEKIYS